MEQVEWDYSERAAHYDKRADYSDEAIDAAVEKMMLAPHATVADIGAGTGKLSRPLAQRGFVVKAIEPNDEMRKRGIGNTRGLDVSWTIGTGENTRLATNSVAAAFFGSSFNVVDQSRTLQECARILAPRGWFSCMWNHRALDDPIQAEIESIIKHHIPNYDYGKRREDPTDIITSSGLFSEIFRVERSFKVSMPRADVVNAWRSHATLSRQAGGGFENIILDIDKLLAGYSSLDVPYVTRVWFSRLAK